VELEISTNRCENIHTSVAYNAIFSIAYCKNVRLEKMTYDFVTQVSEQIQKLDKIGCIA